MTDRITVLCTTCFDALGCTRILAILPQRICARCGTPVPRLSDGPGVIGGICRDLNNRVIAAQVGVSL